MLDILLAVVLAVSAALLIRTKRSSAARDLFAKVPGPAAESWIAGSYGHYLNAPALETTRKWTKEYGPVLRFKGLFGADRLAISDPVALQYCMNVAAYRMPKTAVSRNRTARVLGEGLAWAEGDVHKKQRKVITPSFIAGRIRELHECIVTGAKEVVTKWRKDLDNGPRVINVVDDLSRTTLDVLGRGAFGVELNALENPDQEEIRIYRGFMSAAFSSLSVLSLLVNELTPVSWSNAMLRLPTARQKNLLYRNRVAEGFGERIVRRKVEMIEREDATAGNDVLANFLRANKAERERDHLSFRDIVQQVRTLIFAGHDTTTQTLSLTLYLLALHPTFQERVRKEAIDLVEADATAEDYESAPLVNAAIKESMRLLPAVPTFSRITTQEELIPLGHPLTLSDGAVVDKLLLPARTEILGCLSDYNTSPEVWGEDADEYNPDRFLRDSGPTLPGQLMAGSFGGTLSFLTGPRTCLGWRLSAAEMQVVLAHLLASFRFEPREPNMKLHLVNAPIMSAQVDGKSQIPLRVSFL